MVADVGNGAVRELVMVLVFGIAGLLLALLAAFTPWYGVCADADRAEVVEVHAPPGTRDRSEAK